MPVVRFRRLSPTALAPLKMTEHAAGYDLAADLPSPVTLQPLERLSISTGLAIALPEGFEAQIRPRSGLALKHGIGILNSPGTVDADYRGEIRVILFNLSQEPFVIEPGMRIAQMVIAQVVAMPLAESDSLNETERNAGGFGHTGY